MRTFAGLLIFLFASVSFGQPSPTTWEGWAKLADSQLLANNNDGAIASATECIKLNPSAKDCYATRGALNSTLKRNDIAVPDLKKAIELGHTSPIVHLMLAEAAVAIKSYDLAISTATKSITTFSTKLSGTDLADHYFVRAVAYINSGKHAEGLSDITSALKAGGATFSKIKKGHPYTVRSIVYCKKGEFDLAVYDEKKAKEYGAKITKPCDETDSALASGRPIDLEASGKRMGSSLHILNGLGAIVDGNMTKAIDDFTKAIAMYPRSAEAYFHRAEVHQRTNNIRSAKSDVEQAIKLNPNYEEAFVLKQEIDAILGIDTPAAAANETVLFFDGFDDNRHNWPIGKNDYAEGYIRDGRKTIDITTNVYHKTMLGAGVSPKIDQTKDFMIETSILFVSGNGDYPYGVEWGMKDLANLFDFGIFPNGKFYYGKSVAGVWIPIVAETKSTAVRTGIGATNKLSARKRGDKLELYVNDTLVATTKYEPFTAPASIGFSVGYSKKIAIDYLRVVQFK